MKGILVWEHADLLAQVSVWHSLTTEFQHEHTVYDKESRRETTISEE